MPARKAVLTQTELKRYLAAYRDAGIPVGRTEIGPDGTVGYILRVRTHHQR